MPSLYELSDKFGINTKKPFFPVNSLRLMYFIIGDFFVPGNAEVLDKISSLVPKVEAVLSARMQYRGSAQNISVVDEIKAVEGPLGDVYAVVDTPEVRQMFNHLFTYVFPLQDELFLSFYEDINADKAVSIQHLQLILRARAMDSITFSILISELLRTYVTDEKEFEKFKMSLEWHFNLMYQLNDLVDSIIFAKDDLEASSFSLFQIIRKIAPESAAAKEMIKDLLQRYRDQGNQFAFAGALQELIGEYYDALVKVVQS